MRKFLKSTQVKIFLFVFAALLVGVLLAAVGHARTSPLSKVVSVVFTPLQKVSSTLSEKAHWFSSSFASANTLKNENEELRAKLADYENQLIDYGETKKKLRSYEKALEVKKQHSDFTLLPANVIGTDRGGMYTSLVLDQGSSDDVALGDPVISEGHLVGIVKKVNPADCVVHTLLNPTVNVGALESKTREGGFVTTDTYQSENGKCMLRGLERSTQVMPGALVVTSGVGGLYPKGLLIGTVSQILESDVDLTAYAVLEPAADYASLEDVFIITEFKGQGIEQPAD